jgi:8-oxo-dGTP pyrophosphatase MutT (NUDIX family)
VVSLTDFLTVCDRLRAALSGPLPGLSAQTWLAPRPRAGWRPAFVPEDARKAAGLLLLYPVAGEPHLALTVRATRLLNHSGQVSLPGGRLEPGETFTQAALREAEEEAGVRRDAIEILGALTPLHIPVSGYVLSPIVGATLERPAFVPAEAEVARVLDVPLPLLARPETLRLRRRVHEGKEYEVPYFAVEDEQVWGATAMVLAEFLSVLGWNPVDAQVGGREYAG